MGKILIVEDDSYWQQLLAETLEDRHETVVVSTFEQAKEALDEAARTQLPFHVVTVDMDLPGVIASAPPAVRGGYRIVDYVNRIYPHMSCVVVTGLPDISPTDVRDFFKQYHVDDFVDKSQFDLSMFAEIVNRAVESKQKNQFYGASLTGRQLLGRYEILNEIGHGGMGIVYRAYDPNINRIVAIKTLRPEFSLDRALRLRFQQEARSAGRLTHPNITAIYDADQDQNTVFIVMEFLDGETLAQVLERPIRLTHSYIVDILCQICDGLDYAHRQGVIHRDIKPSNVMLVKQCERLRAKITDFGIAQMLNATQYSGASGLCGTVGYMSPEQLQDRPVDHRSDLYSLGVMLYEMLTGRLPFDSQNPSRVILGHIFEPWPIPAEMPDFFVSILTRLSAKNPDHRFASAGELARAIKLTAPQTSRVHDES